MSNVRRHRKHPSDLMHLSFVAVANTSLGSAGGGSVLIASQAASCPRSRRTRVPGRVVNASLGSAVVGAVLNTSQVAVSSGSGHGGKLVALYQRQEAQPMRARPKQPGRAGAGYARAGGGGALWLQAARWRTSVPRGSGALL